MVLPAAMLACPSLFTSKTSAFCLGLILCLGSWGCGSQKEPKTSPIGQTRADGAVGREIEAPDTSVEAPEGEEAAPLSRQDLNAIAAAEEEARHAAWARAALAEIPSPSNDLGVVVALDQRASDLPWLLAIQNRGEQPVSLVALPELLMFEVVPQKPTTEEAAAPAPAPKKWAKPPPPPPQIWCGGVPKDASADSKVTLLPSEILVYTFDPRGYCDDPDVLQAGATIKARYGFPLETKKVWRKGKMVEEVLPPKAPLAFELAPATSMPTTPIGGAAGGATNAASNAPGATSPPAGGASTTTPTADQTTPPPVAQLKHVVAEPFVLDETYPLERVAPLGRIDPAAASQASAPSATSSAAPQDAAAALDPNAPGGTSEEAAAPTVRPPPPPPLTLTIKPLGATSNPGGSTVTVTAKNTSGRSMRLFLRRELISYQVTGPTGPTTCRMTSSARAPAPAAYSTLGAGGSLSLTTRLAEACPKGTFDHPGSYTVFARIDAQNDGREHGFVAFTGTAITQQPAALTVRGTGVLARPVMRVTSGK